MAWLQLGVLQVYPDNLQHVKLAAWLLVVSVTCPMPSLIVLLAITQVCCGMQVCHGRPSHGIVAHVNAECTDPRLWQDNLKKAAGKLLPHLQKLGMDDLLPCFRVKSANSAIVLMDLSSCCPEELGQVKLASSLLRLVADGSSWQLTCTFPTWTAMVDSITGMQQCHEESCRKVAQACYSPLTHAAVS